MAAAEQPLVRALKDVPVQYPIAPRFKRALLEVLYGQPMALELICYHFSMRFGEYFVRKFPNPADVATALLQLAQAGYVRVQWVVWSGSLAYRADQLDPLIKLVSTQKHIQLETLEPTYKRVQVRTRRQQPTKPCRSKNPTQNS